MRPSPAAPTSRATGQVAALPDGGYVLVWTDSSRTHNGSAMVGQRYDSLGNKVEVKISQFSSGDQ
jgi:hypothetical protein